jgi:flagellar secretion chaperone FliS
MLVSHHSSAGQYQQAQFATADRGRLLLLMFDGALRFLAQAEDGLRNDRVEEFVAQLGRAQAVIAELLHTLDHKAGGEIAAQLDRLYRFMLEHLVEANVRKSPRHVAEVRNVMAIIADSYRQILAHGMPQLGTRDAA